MYPFCLYIFHKNFTDFHNVPVTNADLDLLQLPVRDTKPTPSPPLSGKAGRRQETGAPLSNC
jgi:hypothetical protein